MGIVTRKNNLSSDFGPMMAVVQPFCHKLVGGVPRKTQSSGSMNILVKAKLTRYKCKVLLGGE